MKAKPRVSLFTHLETAVQLTGFNARVYAVTCVMIVSSSSFVTPAGWIVFGTLYELVSCLRLAACSSIRCWYVYTDIHIIWIKKY